MELLFALGICVIIGLIIGVHFAPRLRSTQGENAVTRVYNDSGEHTGWMLFARDSESTRIIFDDCEIHEEGRLHLYKNGDLVGETDNNFVDADKEYPTEYKSAEEINHILSDHPFADTDS